VWNEDEAGSGSWEFETTASISTYIFAVKEVFYKIMTNHIRRQFLHRDVVSRLGYSTPEMDDLIGAGYLDPDVITAIIMGGKSICGIFTKVPTNGNISSMINQLNTEQQLQFVNFVKCYQSTHPSLRSEAVVNYLRYVRMTAQARRIYNELTSTDLSSIAQRYRPDMRRMLDRFDKDIWNSLTSVSDPFTVTDNQLKGGYKCLVGSWGEWASIRLADMNGVLAHFSVPIRGGEVDLQETDRSGNVWKWIEVKNTSSLQSAWGKAVIQVENYIAQGAKDVVIQLLQQGKPEYPLPSYQRMRNLQELQNEHPDIQFEVVTAQPTDQASWNALDELRQQFPKIQFETIPLTSAIPFDPPVDNWGNQFP
jgi:hypothetical protein